MKTAISKLRVLFFLNVSFFLFSSFTLSGQGSDPDLISVNVASGSDFDGDGFYETWRLKVDVDAYFSDKTASDVYIEVYNSDYHGGNGEVFGPYDFYGYDENDGVELGPFQANGVEGLPKTLDFQVRAYNSLGSEDIFIDVKVDHPKGSVAPDIVRVNQVNAVDSDGDNYYESFSFEVDVDPVSGNDALENVQIDAYTKDDSYSRNFGSHSFSSGNSDIITIGPIDASDVAKGPIITYLYFSATNIGGSDEYVLEVAIDGVDNGPVLTGVTTNGLTDADNDGYYESWSFDVDVDSESGEQINGVTLEVLHIGNVIKTSGPHNFNGKSSADNVVLGPFDYTDFSDGRGEYMFTVRAKHTSGTVQQLVYVQVDNEVATPETEPDLISVNVVGKTDADSDGNLEGWSFRVDVDALYTDYVAGDVYLEVYSSDYHTGNGDIFGPFNFEGYGSNDAVTVGPFTSNGLQGLPKELDFRIKAYNDLGDQSDNVKVKAEWPLREGPPEFVTVTQVNSKDSDGDGYNESVSFEMNIGPEPGDIAKDVYVDVSANGGTFTRTYGPYTFIGHTSADNITIGPFTEDILPAGPAITYFNFTVRNSLGNDTYVLEVALDGDDFGPVIKSATPVGLVDADQDGNNESWSFNVDVDDLSGQAIQGVTLEVRYNGKVIDTSGPHNFAGNSTADNVVMGPFIYTDFMDGKGEYLFSVRALHSFGSAQKAVYVQVDNEVAALVTEPDLLGVDVVAASDEDSDGFFEEWSFEVDVDALYSDYTAKGVYIDVYNSELFDGNGETFGPFDFVGYETGDEVTVGPFRTNGAEGLPDELEFRVKVYNDRGDEDQLVNVRVDQPVGSQAPDIIKVSQVNSIDNDGDTYFERFSFELNVDPLVGALSEGVTIAVSADNGSYTNSFGPYSFNGKSDGDNVTIGPFTEAVLAAGPAITYFYFTVSNAQGSDEYVLEVAVDGDDFGPVIKSLEKVKLFDEDQDDYYERWSFEVDVDDQSGQQIQGVSLEVLYAGKVIKTSGPHNFDGNSTADNVVVGTFRYTEFFDGKEEYLFTVRAVHAYGSDEQEIVVQVDDQYNEPPYTDPDIISVEIVDSVDRDYDGFLEEWSFLVDVDAAYMNQTAADVYFEVFSPDYHSGNGDTFGPFSFVGYDTSDAVIVGPFTSSGIEGLPADMEFRVKAYNGKVDDEMYVDVPVGKPVPTKGPVIVSIMEVNSVDTDTDGYSEQFSLEVDVDEIAGNLLQGVLLEVYTDLNDREIRLDSVVYDFEGSSTADNVILGIFHMGYFSLGKGEYKLRLVASHPDGIAEREIMVKVDDRYNNRTSYNPYIKNYRIIDIVDRDADGYYEEFYFSLDIDPYISSGLAQNSRIKVSYGESGPSRTFGPYHFTGDNFRYVIGPFRLIGPRREVEFHIDAYNKEGDSPFKPLIRIRMERAVPDTDASLKSIVMSKGTLKPGFAADVLSYAVDLPAGTKSSPSIRVYTTSRYASAVITYPKDVLSEVAADRTATVRVTAEDQSVTQSYEILFNVKQAVVRNVLFSQLNLDNLSISAGEDITLVPGGTYELGTDLGLTGGVPPYHVAWFDSEQNLMEGFRPEVQPDQDATYTMVVTDAAGCTLMDELSIKVRPLSSTGTAFEDAIRVWPVPARDRVTVGFPGITLEEVRISIFDSSSSLLRTEEFGPGDEKYEINLHDYAPGMYYLQIDIGDSRVTRKLVINRK